MAAYLRVHPFEIASLDDNKFFRGVLELITNGYSQVREQHFDYFEYFRNPDHDGKKVRRTKIWSLQRCVQGCIP
jgi:hypothetical protein